MELRNLLIGGLVALTFGLNSCASVIGKQTKTSTLEKQVKIEEYAKELYPVFSANDIVMFYNDNVDLAYIKNILAIKDNKGCPAFNKIGDIYDFWDEGCSIDYITSLACIKDEKGNPKLKSWHIKYISRLGLTKNELLDFNDTEKPNALLVAPAYGMPTFYNHGFMEQVKEAYDLHVVVASKEQEVYEAIDKIPNIEILILSGHGTKKNLFLGKEKENVSMDEVGEEHWIDTSDTELEKYLQKLSPYAIIFLNSCANAEGGRDEDNLANFVISRADGRKVIAATKPFGFNAEMTIKSIYPFDIEIRTDNGEIITYSNK